MSKRRKSRTTDRRTPPRALPKESKPSEALTVAWTVSLTVVLVCDVLVLLTAAALSQEMGGDQLRVFHEIVLFAGALAGCLSLALVPIVYRVRTLPPPFGLTVFGICLALAPILTLVARGLLRQ